MIGADVSVSTDPRIVTVTVVVGIIVIVIAAVPKILGPLQTTFESIIDAQRRTAAASKTADVAALRAQVDEVQSVLGETQTELRAFRSETRRYQRYHDHVLSVHAAYDRAMIQLVIRLGGEPLPTPPLWPEQASDSPYGPYDVTPPAARPEPGYGPPPVDGDISDTDHP